MVHSSSSRVHRLRSVPARFVHWMRENGVFYYRRVRVVRCDDPEKVGEEPGGDIDMGEATDEQMRDLAAMQNLETAVWVGRRAKGAMCIVARSGSVPLGYLWITRSAELMTEVDHVLDVSRDRAGAYLFDGYVLSAHRRRGVLSMLLGYSKRWALRNGLSRLYAAYARENRVSEHALQKAGFATVVGDIGILRVLGHDWKRIRISDPRPAIDVLGAKGPPRSSARPT